MEDAIPTNWSHTPLEDDQKALHREALLLQKLRHVNIVQVQGLLVEDGRVIGYGMEVLSKTFDAQQNGRLTRERLAGALSPTCKAVYASSTRSLLPIPTSNRRTWPLRQATRTSNFWILNLMQRSSRLALLKLFSLWLFVPLDIENRLR